MAPRRDVHVLAASTAGRVPPVGQGSACTHPRPQAVRAENWVGRITTSWDRLYDKRGVLLVQLPPGMERDDARLDFFLSALPWWLPTAVEFRHPSWVSDEVFRLLERHQSAYVVMSGAGLPCVLRATAPIVYVRLHGPDARWLYAGSYSDQELRWWADRIREWQSQGREVYAYFNNDADGNAVRNARTLRAYSDNSGAPRPPNGLWHAGHGSGPPQTPDPAAGRAATLARPGHESVTSRAGRCCRSSPP